MKSHRFFLSFLGSALLVLLALCGPLQAQVGTDFTIVADSSQPQFQGRGFGTYPSISDDGTVAFVVDQVGTFRAEPGKTPVMVGGSVTGDPFINKLGEIASRQYVDAFLTTELYKSTSSGQVVPLVRNDADFRQFGTPVHLSAAGTAVFWARKNPYSPREWGIWTATGNGAPSLVVNDRGVFNVFGGSPTINSAGTVAFAASKDPVNNVSELGLYVGSVGGDAKASTVLTAAGSPLYNWDGGPYINDKGQIAFKAYEHSTGEPGIFVVNQDGSGLRTVARAGGGDGPYSMFDSPIINEGGTVAFRGYLDTGERGIYVGPNPVADKVVQQGDALFGSTATSVVFLRGLNNNNQVAFYFELADGRSGIGTARLNLAAPAPEPSATATPTPTATATATATPTVPPQPSPTPTATAAPSASASPTPSVAPSPTPAAQTQPLNIATRVRVETGENVGIAGFIVTGNSPKKVVIRGLGPSLREAGVVNALPDPALELHSSDGTLLAKNGNWRDDLDPAVELESNGFAPKNELESAIIATLAPGLYTAMISGQNSVTGIGLVEVYDFNQTGNSLLANISTRARVEASESVLIGGFILGNGGAPTKVMVRALGPSLASAGINNALPDPTLELHDRNGALLLANDNWKDGQQAAIEQTGIPPNDPSEAAIVADLGPGAYTAVVTGKNGAAGVALVEVYNLR